MFLNDPLQWIALAFAMANKSFKERLFREVGPNAFDGLSRDVYEQLEFADSDYQRARCRHLLDLDATGKLSDRVLEYLAGIAQKKWKFRFHQRGYGKAAFLNQIIKEATAQLAAMARHDGEKSLQPEEKDATRKNPTAPEGQKPQPPRPGVEGNGKTGQGDRKAAF